MSSRVRQHASVALLIIGAVSVCSVSCRGGGAGQTGAAANHDAQTVVRAADETLKQFDAQRRDPIAAYLLRTLAKDIPELAPLEADVTRVEQAALAEITAKAKALSRPKAMDGTAPPLIGRMLRPGAGGRPLPWYSQILAAGFGSVSAQGETGGGSGTPNLGVLLGYLATDLADTLGGSNMGPVTASSSSNGVSGSMGIEFGTGATGVRTSSLSFNLDVTKDGVTLSVKVSFKTEGDPCPDANGKLAFKYSVIMRGDAAAQGKRSGLQKELTGSATGQVDDEAYLTQVDFDSRIQSSVQRPASHDAFDDYTLKGSISGRWTDGVRRHITSKAATVRIGSKTDQDDVNELSGDGNDETLKIVTGYLLYLQSQWRDGHCVAVVAPVPSSVKPSSSTSVDVSVKQKRDGTAIHAPVDLTLQGQASIKPARVAPSPGTATYVAPGEKGSHAKLTFKSTSRRGIGTLDADVTVGRTGYDAKGGQNIAISGSVCGGVESPFTLQGRPPDGSSVTFNYSPTSEKGGSYTYQGGGGGFTFSGKGIYTITKGADDTLSMRQGDAGCVNGVPGGCAGHVNTVTLTPTDSCK
jgi:hypothetical protein